MRCEGIAEAHKLRRKVCGLAQKVGPLDIQCATRDA